MAASTAIKQYWGNASSGEYEEVRMLYSAHGATDDGVWLAMDGVQSLHLIVQGASPVGTVTIGGSHGTNSTFDIPANSADGESLGSVTNNGVTSLQVHQITRYVKVHLSAFTSGTFDVFLKLRRKSNG